MGDDAARQVVDWPPPSASNSARRASRPSWSTRTSAPSRAAPTSGRTSTSTAGGPTRSTPSRYRLRAAYADLVDDVERQYGVRPTTFRAAGVLRDDARLPRVRRGRRAARALPDVAQHLHRPGRRATERRPRLQRPAALVHRPPGPRPSSTTSRTSRRSPGSRRSPVRPPSPHRRDVLGVGDASGLFPIDSAPVESAPATPATGTTTPACLATTQDLLGERVPDLRALAARGARRRRGGGRSPPRAPRGSNPTGTLEPAWRSARRRRRGHGHVATNAVAPRTGNVSVGTSIFAMVVLERPLSTPHEELDVVTTPVRRRRGDGALQQRGERDRRVGAGVRAVRGGDERTNGRSGRRRRRRLRGSCSAKQRARTPTLTPAACCPQLPRR